MHSGRFTHALVRAVSRSLARCELAHLPRREFDLDLARRQHARYVAALEAAGVAVTVLPEAPELPDSVFVEDPVVVLDEFAVLGRLGAASREPEAGAMSQEVTRFRPLVHLQAPATLEGGDVLRMGRTLFVGQSARTNGDGIAQLRRAAARFDYRVVPVAVSGCLHLKTGATSPAAGVVLANPAWVDVRAFEDREIVPVPASEPFGANVLPVNGRVLVAASASRTADLLAGRGLAVELVDVSELQKAEAGLTCLSVLYAMLKRAGDQSGCI